MATVFLSPTIVYFVLCNETNKIKIVLEMQSYQIKNFKRTWDHWFFDLKYTD